MLIISKNYINLEVVINKVSELQICRVANLISNVRVCPGIRRLQGVSGAARLPGGANVS